MKNKVLETIKKYKLIDTNDKIVIGVSGGPDSICLLHILNELKTELNIEIFVAHINHMIRKEAEEETTYVENFCKHLGIQCFTKRIDIISKSKQEKIGVEESGRLARYSFFEEVLNSVQANKIATAHNANDNAETVLMNIFRGAGTSGLKGIEPIRNNKFIRPIIECERTEIEQYCEENNLQPKIDKSNFENVYTRNKIRNIFIPQIKEEFNSNIIMSLNRLSKIASEENEFLQKYCKSILENELIIEQSLVKMEEQGKEENQILVLDMKKFNNLDTVLKNRIILLSIEKVLGNVQGIEKIHIDDIVKMCAKNIGNKYLMPNKKIKVFVKGGKMYFEAVCM